MLKKLLIATALIASATSSTLADPPKGYVSVKPTSKDHPLKELVSGYWYRDPATRAIQDDEFQNPGMLLVEAGKELWSKVDGKAGKSCASCHGDPKKSMANVGTSFPKMMGQGDKRTLRNVESQINVCRTENMQAEPWKLESKDMLAMTVFTKHQSLGKPVNVKVDGEAAKWFEKGKAMYYTRTGQLDLSCSHCHEMMEGKYIRSDHLSQGQINGFPLYRLKDQAVLSVHKRFEGCIRDTRAEFPKAGSDDLLALELYVAWRGNGLPVETPAVRH